MSIGNNNNSDSNTHTYGWMAPTTNNPGEATTDKKEETTNVAAPGAVKTSISAPSTESTANTGLFSGIKPGFTSTTANTTATSGSTEWGFTQPAHTGGSGHSYYNAGGPAQPFRPLGETAKPANEAINSPAKPFSFSQPGAPSAAPITKPIPFGGYGTPEKKVEQPAASVPLFGGISSSTPRKSSLEGSQQTPSKTSSTTAAVPTPAVASPWKPSVQPLSSSSAAPTTFVPTATPSSVPVAKAETVSTSATPRKRSLSESEPSGPAVASPRKPSLGAFPTTTAAPAAASPRKASLEKATPAVATGTPQRPAHEAPAQSSFVTPLRDDAKIKEQQQSASAAALTHALEQQQRMPEAPKPVPVDKLETPSKKATRSESIDDSWVKVEKEEAQEERPIAAAAAEKKKAATAAEKKDRVPPKAKPETPAGMRRTSSRARQAPAELPIEAPVKAASGLKTSPSGIVSAGAGTKFADISHIAGMLAKKKSGDKTILLAHRLLYGRPGEANKRKANLRLFNGLPPAHDKPAMEKKLAALTVSALRDLCILFNLERSGEKLAMGQRVYEFLASPKDYGKSKAVAPAKKATGKRKASATKAAGGKKAKTAGGKLSEETVESEDEEDFSEEIASLQAESQQ